jgi:transcriptional regulator with XRE-family HTH domain
MINRTAGERLKAVRKYFDFSQLEFSKMLGYSSVQALSNMHKPGRTISIDKAQILQDQLGVNMTWLLSGKGPMFYDEDLADGVLGQRGITKIHPFADDEAAEALLDAPDRIDKTPPSVSIAAELAKSVEDLRKTMNTELDKLVEQIKQLK